MKQLLRQNMLLGVASFIILCAPAYSGHVEPWIDSGDLFTLKINMTADQVIEQLGSPLYIEAVNDQDEQIITKNLYYNFRTKQYKHESPDKAVKGSESDMSWGRKTTVQFTFIEDQLVGWEEDKLTLNMAVKDNSKSLLKYFSLFLNIVLAVKVFSM